MRTLKHSLLLMCTLVLGLAGCSSTPSQRITPKDDPAANVKLQNTDFQSKAKISYSQSQDHYGMATSGNALAGETAEKMSRAEAVDLAKGQDPLATMMLFCYQKEFKEGFGLAEQLFETHQKLPTYWNQVATCHLLQGNERKALLFYNKAMEVVPNYVPALNNIGVIYGRSAQDQKALVALEKALAGGRFTKTPRYNLAYLLLHYGMGQQALGHFQAMLEESPQDADLRTGLAMSYVLLSRWEDAWGEFSRIPDELRSRPSVGLNMALTAHRLGKKEAARNLLSKVESMDSAYGREVRQLIGE
jgi:tetratricopeptide (TPR) repeat protein